MKAAQLLIIKIHFLHEPSVLSGEKHSVTLIQLTEKLFFSVQLQQSSLDLAVLPAQLSIQVHVRYNQVLVVGSALSSFLHLEERKEG